MKAVLVTFAHRTQIFHCFLIVHAAQIESAHYIVKIVGIGVTSIV